MASGRVIDGSLTCSTIQTFVMTKSTLGCAHNHRYVMLTSRTGRGSYSGVGRSCVSVVVEGLVTKYW